MTGNKNQDECFASSWTVAVADIYKNRAERLQPACVVQLARCYDGSIVTRITFVINYQ